MTYYEAKDKLKEYQNMNFTKWVKEGLKKVEKSLDIYIKNYDDKWIYFDLKQAIYDLTIEMKAEAVTGQLSKQMNLELKNYLWSLLLVERMEENEN